MLEDIVSDLESENKSPGYIADLMKTVRSWLRYNDVVPTRRIKISNSTATPTIENEQILADLRPQTLGNYDGSDGLTMKDLPELKIEGILPARYIIFILMASITFVSGRLQN